MPIPPSLPIATLRSHTRFLIDSTTNRISNQARRGFVRHLLRTSRLLLSHRKKRIRASVKFSRVADSLPGAFAGKPDPHVSFLRVKLDQLLSEDGQIRLDPLPRARRELRSRRLLARHFRQNVARHRANTYMCGALATHDLAHSRARERHMQALRRSSTSITRPIELRRARLLRALSDTSGPEKPPGRAPAVAVRCPGDSRLLRRPRSEELPRPRGHARPLAS